MQRATTHWLICLALLLATPAVAQTPPVQTPPATPTQPSTRPARPNVIVILADDLGFGDVGCFGQKTLQTPRLNAMALEGIRFTQFYAGSPLSGPAQGVLLTGRHVGRAAVRGNSARPVVLPADQPTTASMLKRAGYATAWIGKWDAGTVDPLTRVNDLGFDHFYGYLNRWHAQNTYPAFLIRNGKVETLRNEVSSEWRAFQDPKHPQAGRGVAIRKVDDAPGLLLADAMQFIRKQHASPIFLTLALNTPQVNDETGDKAVPEPVDLGDLALRNWSDANKAFAAHVRHLDRDVGRVLDLLQELKIDRQTLVIFTSDNGPRPGSVDNADLFDSAGPYRLAAHGLGEGSIRVPMIARWPGVIPPGLENNRQWYAGDVMATLAELAGLPAPEGLDSDSFVEALHGRPNPDQWKRKSPLYWEVYEGAGAQAVRFGKWKAVRSPMLSGPVELYDLSWDHEEKRDYAPRRADLVRHATNLLNKHHHPDPQWTPAHAASQPASPGAAPSK